MTRSTSAIQGRKTLGTTSADDEEDVGGRAWAIEYRDDPEAIGEHDEDGPVVNNASDEGQSK